MDKRQRDTQGWSSQADNWQERRSSSINHVHKQEIEDQLLKVRELVKGITSCLQEIPLDFDTEKWDKILTGVMELQQIAIVSIQRQK